MNPSYVRTEVEKIYKNSELTFPKNIALCSAWLMANFKGHNLKILELKGRTSLADYFVIGSASNATQARAMADAIKEEFHNLPVQNISYEGLSNSEWILLDYGDIIVHIFQENARSYYDLDRLWIDAPQVKIPENYYTTADQEKLQNHIITNTDDRKFF